MKTQHIFKAIYIGLAICISLVIGGPTRKNCDDEKQRPIPSVDVNISINETEEATDSVSKVEDHPNFTLNDFLILNIELILMFGLVIICTTIVVIFKKEDGKLQGKMPEEETDNPLRF